MLCMLCCVGLFCKSRSHMQYIYVFVRCVCIYMYRDIIPIGFKRYPIEGSHFQCKATLNVSSSACKEIPFVRSFRKPSWPLANNKSFALCVCGFRWLGICVHKQKALLLHTHSRVLLYIYLYQVNLRVFCFVSQGHCFCWRYILFCYDSTNCAFSWFV